MKIALLALLLAAVTNTAAGPAAPVHETVTAYTAAGNAVVLDVTDRRDPDCYSIIAAAPAAVDEIAAASNEAYTLWTIGPGGVYELWAYGFETDDISDDIIADFQTWDFPSVRSLEWYQGSIDSPGQYDRLTDLVNVLKTTHKNDLPFIHTMSF